MLTINNIKYPAYFHSSGNGTVCFRDQFNGMWNSGRTCRNLTVDHFIEMHNAINPENSERKDYFYYSSIDCYDSIAKISDITKMMQSENFKPSRWKISSNNFAILKYTECKIENMPLGAKLIAIKNEGEWHDFSFTAKRIEINDDVICLLAHFGQGKSNPFTGEMNIKRGTMVRYK